MFEFQCDSCLKSHTGATRNASILAIKHDRHCESFHGIPIHYTRINKVKQAFFCLNCENENHADCVGMQNESFCECPKCYLRIPEN